MNIIKKNGNRLATWMGVIAPALFVTIFTLEGRFRPGYDPRAMYISALSIGPRGWIQIVNFLQMGILLLVFALALARTYSNVKAVRNGVVVLIILAVLFVLSGLFIMDPDGTPQARMSMHGLVHGLAGGFVFLLMPVTCFILFPFIRSQSGKRVVVYWMLALSIFEAVSVFFFTLISKLPQSREIFNGWIGLIQRTALVPFMLWLFLFGLMLLSAESTRKEYE